MKLVKNLTNKKSKKENLIESIKERIKWDSRLSNSEVIIKIQDGEVQVTGTF